MILNDNYLKIRHHLTPVIWNEKEYLEDLKNINFTVMMRASLNNYKSEFIRS